jgi:hypothetical protein
MEQLFVEGLGGMYAARKGAQIKFETEEFVLGMEQRSIYAARKDAQIKSNREECAQSMGQRE